MRRAFLLLLGCASLAAAQTVDLDPARTSITFTLGSVLHTVHGSFKLKHGNMRFDSDTSKAGGEIVVDVTSASTGNDSRDRRMHKEILESERYPDATFIPDRITGTLASQGESEIDVHGVFQFHGASHELTLHLLVQNENRQIRATTDFEIPYIKWGLKNPSTFVLRVSDKVQMHIEAFGRLLRDGAVD